APPPQTPVANLRHAAPAADAGWHTQAAASVFSKPVRDGAYSLLTGLRFGFAQCGTVTAEFSHAGRKQSRRRGAELPGQVSREQAQAQKERRKNAEHQEAVRVPEQDGQENGDKYQAGTQRR